MSTYLARMIRKGLSEEIRFEIRTKGTKKSVIRKTKKRKKIQAKRLCKDPEAAFEKSEAACVDGV